jgi:hyaluronan synthase
VLFLIPFAFAYLQAARYFTVRRSDMSFASQFFSFLIAPLALLWSIVVLRAFRLYSFVTWYRTGWGTREEVEIPES